MGRRHALIPSAMDLLEDRVVPSRLAPGARVDGLGPDPHGTVLVRQGQSPTAEVNQYFDLFRNDYDQARATYFTSIQGQANPSQATTYAFVAYTTQRVSLLAQQTLSILPAKHTPGEAHALKRLVTAKIMGPRAQMPPGSLAASLLATIPQPGTTAPTSSLYSLSQDNAIASAQVAILNGVENL